MAIRPENFAFLCQLLKKRSAIDLNADKAYLVEARLQPVAKLAQFSSVDALIDRLRSSPNEGLLHEVVDAMTTNETSFFRDSTPFHVLGDTVLPQLLERRSSVRTINIWSAGCASGQEPYTLAMLWSERFSDLDRWRLKLLATDISRKMLDRAREGHYTQLEVERGLSTKQLAKHFRQDGEHWRIADPLKSMVEFRLLNLIGSWPRLPPMDVVFLRNVLVYFDAAAKREILSKVRSVMQPDGCLFLGGSETTLMIDDAFNRVSTPSGSYYTLK